MARRRHVLETGEEKALDQDAEIEVPQLGNVPGVSWAEHPGLKVEIEKIWRDYLQALSRPVIDLPVSKVVCVFQKAQDRTVAFERDVVHDQMLSANSYDRRLLRAAVAGALSPGAVADESDGGSLQRFDAARDRVADALHELDMAQGEILAALQAAESTDDTDAELRDNARERIVKALRSRGIEATTDRNGPLVLLLMQLEQKETEDAEEDEKRRRNLSSDLAKLLKDGTSET